MPTDNAPVDIHEIVQAYRDLTFAARQAYFDHTLTPEQRDARNSAFITAADQHRMSLPQELGDLLLVEHDLSTIAYEEVLKGSTRQEIRDREDRAEAYTDKIAAYLAAHPQPS